jgi:hypothetical protein
MFMSDIAIGGVGDGDLAEILRNYERFWGDRDLPRYLHHPMFFLEFRDTAFVARDLGTGEIAGYLLGFVAPAGDGYVHFARSGNSVRRPRGLRLPSELAAVLRRMLRCLYRSWQRWVSRPDALGQFPAWRAPGHAASREAELPAPSRHVE